MKEKITKLIASPPVPTVDNPYIQLDWLFERYIRQFKNSHTRIAYQKGLIAYKKFLKETNGYDERLADDHKYLLAVHCDEFALYKVATYWKESKYSSNTITQHVRSIRSLFNYAVEEGYSSASMFLNPMIAKPEREALYKAVYEDFELKFIWKTITPAFEFAKRIVAGYHRTGCGVDPRIPPADGEYKLDASSRKRKVSPWSKWENIVWYFENVLNCKFLNHSALKADHAQFTHAIRYFHGSSNEVFKRLGSPPIIGVDLLAPLAMKLCFETGLNTESALNLKRDAYVDHHSLTNLPYIRYYKERSSGEKDLHLSLFDSKNKEIPISLKQSEVIKKTFDTILKLTAPLVEQADEKFKDFLFIYQANNKTAALPYGYVTKLNPRNFHGWAKPLLINEKKKGDENVPEVMNLGRFRPTKITQMVRDGKDFFEIQSVAGHASGKTTMGYINSYKINPQAKREISEVLVRIHKNSEEFMQDPKPYADISSQKQEGVVYKGVFCDCKNVYDPPESVKRLKTYKEGDSCTYYNMCLTCHNVLITKKHLPRLVIYRNEILNALSNNLHDAPNKNHYQKALAIIDGILVEFSEEDITWATEIAECSDEHIDPLTYKAVKNEK